MTLHVNVERELLDAHDGEQSPPPNDIEDWYGGDLLRAIEEGIAEIDHVEVEDVVRLDDAED